MPVGDDFLEPSLEEESDEQKDQQKFLASVTKPKRERSATISDSQWKVVRAELQRINEEAAWTQAQPRHFVALYEVLHERVYGVLPAELRPTDRARASALASSFMKREFGGDSTLFVEFMKWAWVREEQREKWRRDNNREGGRLGWKLMFNGSLLTDYRLFAHRKGNSL